MSVVSSKSELAEDAGGGGEAGGEVNTGKPGNCVSGGVVI